MIDELKSYIDGLIIMDSHEHLAPWENQRNAKDIFGEYLFHYFCVDLVSSGLSQENLQIVKSGDLSVIEKWNIVKKIGNSAATRDTEEVLTWRFPEFTDMRESTARQLKRSMMPL